MDLRSMLQQRIQLWLASSMDFQIGVGLLEELDPASIYMKMFRASGSTRFNASKLEQLLRDNIAPVAEVTPGEQASLGYPTYDFFSLPEDLQRDHIRKSELYRAAGQVRQTLIEATTDEERARCADLIMSYMEENQRCWERIDYFLQNGAVMKETTPVLPDLEGMDTVSLARFKANNASNLSKWKRKLLRMPESKAKVALETRIIEHQRLQEEVMRLL